MKLAVTAKGPELDSEVDPRFGRAMYIIVVDEESLDFEAVDNSANANAFKGAGIQAATMISGKGAEVLLTGYCGPKAFQVLVALGNIVLQGTHAFFQALPDNFGVLLVLVRYFLPDTLGLHFGFLSKGFR